MDIYTDSIRDLPAIDRLLLVEKIWSDLTKLDGELPLSPSILEEARDRRDAMIADPTLGKAHDQVWSRIEAWRNG